MNAEPSVRFIVTGFGPFGDSRQNPTTAIAERIVHFLRVKGEHAIAASTLSMVVEVSLEAARQQVDAIFKEIGCTNDNAQLSRPSEVIILHLGVNYRGKTFQLESYAYNDADFRIPDERGYQPKHEPIIKEIGLGEPLRTNIDIPPLVQELNRSRCKYGNVAKAICSTDAGRYVCNYIYYYSLSKCRGVSRFPSVRCMFLHVPPHAIADETDQLNFVVDLMVALKRRVEYSQIFERNATPP
jgi:pyroglutamyl-peptidase